MKNLLLIGIALFSFYTIKAQDFTSNGIKYRIISSSNLTVEVIAQTPKYTGKIVIPSTVSYNSKSYTVTGIGNAFNGCSGLTSISLPDSVTSIGNYAFFECSGLQSIKLPNSVTSIGGRAFYGCSGLTSISLPNSLTNISFEAFVNCTSLTSISIPNSVTSIGVSAFFGCKGLTSITLPNSLTSIDWWTFTGCTSLTSINIPNSVTSIGDHAFNGCFGLTSINIPNTVTSIGEKAFSYCIRLTSIDIPNSVTNIGNNTFEGCENLTSITLPNSLTSIGISAFNGCSGLTSISIPNSVTSIGDNAFYNCSALTSIICEAITPPTLGSNVFGDVNKTIPLHVPESSVDLYKAAYTVDSSNTTWHILIPNQWKDFNVQTLSTVNTNNLTIHPKLKLYPNPATSVITIEIPNNNSQSNLLMFDNTGSLVLNKQLFGTTQISIDELKSGMYLYQYTQDGTVTNGKLIVK